MKPKLSGHNNSVISVAFSPDGKTLASRSWNKKIKLWKLKGLVTLNNIYY